ncbi:MAG: hypothetical protein PHF51_04320 [Candidatus ainarchaeum sp.]|nr:hypothetical protein [Candidatus ainarchaeum sp.]
MPVLSKIKSHELPVGIRYAVRLIGFEEKDALLGKLLDSKKLFQAKARLHYTSCQFVTNVEEFHRMWLDNFYSADEQVFSHSIIYAVNDGGGFEVLYENRSRTLIVRNCDYYGWVKSMALALVGDVLEDYSPSSRRYSVHGSAIDYNGRGLAMMAPSGTGKTTLTYGLLLRDYASYISDDWFFVRAYPRELSAYSSEKNSYIREDLPKVWSEYGELEAMVKLDNKKRGIADLARAIGFEKIRRATSLTTLVLLKRDKGDPRKEYALSAEEAFAYLKENDYCNPQHQLVRDGRKIRLRDAFFRLFTKRLDCFMLNTTETQRESLARLEKIVGRECRPGK